MITKTLKIAEGVNINYIRTDKFKSNIISFNFITQAQNEAVHLNSMIPLILLRGCRKYPTQSEINKKLQYLYSGVIDTKNEKHGEFQIFGFDIDMLNDKYANGAEITKDSTELLCDIIFDPYLDKGAFSEQYLENEKINLIDTIEAEINNKTKYSTNRCVEEMSKGTAFAVKRFGEVENVEKITPKTLYDAYLKALKTIPVEIYVVGDCDFELIADEFEKRFSNIERTIIAPSFAQIKRKAEKVSEIDEKQDIKQGKLCLGFRTGKNIQDGDYHVAHLFSEIFGASPTSKLFVNVREKMSLCYYCRSMLSQRTGIMLVAAGIKFEDKEITQKAILDQLEAIKNGDISQEELENAKRSLRNSYMQVYDNPSAMQTWTLYRAISENYDIPIGEAEKVEKTTVEEISAYAKNITLDTVYFLKGEDANG
ncbi:MAG: insulinase family protein [Clostridia bacterium]|nr:insulinase family protein [Clostridia bacterium]